MSSPTAVQRARTRRSIIVVVTAVGIALGFAFYGILQADFEGYRYRIIDILEKITGRPVDLKSVDLSLARGLALRLNDLTIGATDPAEPPLFQVREAFLGLGPGAFFEKKLDFSSLTLKAPQFNLVLRHDQGLLERAESTARTSSEKMHNLLGAGLPALSVGAITIRDGLLTVLDWGHEESSTLIFDNIQFILHDISPKHASPLSATARFQDVPFTANGQIGPLPTSLDLSKMPVLISLEAKSVDLDNLSETLAGPRFQPKAQRSYFSTLLHGALADGLQTTSRLEVDKLVLEEVTTGKAHPPVDLAFRQKSLFTLPFNTWTPKLEIQEAFFYLDGRPVLDIKGRVSRSAVANIELQASTITAFEPEHMPWFGPFKTMEGSVEGNLRIQGSWPGEMQFYAALDLTPLGFTLGPVLKKATGTALGMDATIAMGPGWTKIKALELSRGPGNLVSVTGEIAPEMDLQMDGTVNLNLLTDYIDANVPLPLDGFLQTRLHFFQPEGSLAVEGGIHAGRVGLGRLSLQDFSAQVKTDVEGLRIAPFQASLGGGQVSGGLFTALSEGDAPVFVSHFTVNNANLEGILGEAGEEAALLPGGVLNAEGAVEGFFGPRFAPSDAFSGWARLLVKKGFLRGEGLEAPPLSDWAVPGTGEEAEPEVQFHWAAADLEVTGQKLRLTRLALEGDNLHIDGEGRGSLGEAPYRLNLVAGKPGDGEKREAITLTGGLLGGLRLVPTLPNPQEAVLAPAGNAPKPPVNGDKTATPAPPQ